ncbi:hypothetical protein P152DRAFT_456811 [Eremomyces bilateralis CBS 781.70]|uniref:RTA1-domain-containing protein n=1 Tax=Eremomyces bilateralis CBS 781.70 TaxID=1392243 RepID=A0A6G1G951_9PEZI|nr:uncharacterized protein P152DRAFT_456811 [Eremomyces bilateralis CBS 781.70]KAF1814543.1 hypothetical protein P152DRAFT_456811 [Eremomyces bilateralis CBS 781.70]
MPWAALLLCTGMVTREVGAYHISDLGILIASNVLVMSGPPVYAAINYLIFSRVLFYVPYLSSIHPGRVVTTFLAIDGIVEIITVNGVVRVTNSSLTDAQRTVGSNMIRAGLITQAVMFFVFILFVADFHRKALKINVLNSKLRTVLIIIYVSCAIVTARCIYRIAEYFQGWEGELYTNETYFWVFDGAFMLVNTFIMNIWHPGKRLPKSNHTFLSKDGKTELRGPGWNDTRPFWVTFFDPFDVYGLVTKRDQKTKFWELDGTELEEYTRRERSRQKFARPWYLQVVDPFHLGGSNGLLAKAFGLCKEKPTSEPPASEKELTQETSKATDDVSRIV